MYGHKQQMCDGNLVAVTSLSTALLLVAMV
jgi:hypothetical protein